jgi:hypothetical protein
MLPIKKQYTLPLFLQKNIKKGNISHGTLVNG